MLAFYFAGPLLIHTSVKSTAGVSVLTVYIVYMHPSIHPYMLQSCSGSQGKRPIPAAMRQEAWYILDMSSVLYRATETQITMCAPIIPMDDSESTVNRTSLILDSGRKLTYLYKTHASMGKNITSTMKNPCLDLNREPV